MKEYLKFKRSFTLIELLVVIAIIGLLSSVILVSLSGPRQKAKITKALEFSQSVQHAIGNEAVGVWNFDDCSAKDVSGYGNNGTINGATCVDDTPYKIVGSGQGKNALSFDGVNDYIVVSQNSSINIENGSFFVGMWFKTNTVLNNGRVTGLLYKRAGGPVAFLMSLVPGSGIIRWNYYDGTNDLNLYSSVRVDNSLWHFVGWNRNGTNFSLYLDGVMQNSNVSTMGSMTNAGNLEIGSGIADGWNYFNGIIDEVRLYGTALSVGQIQQLYLAGLEKHQQLTIK